MRSSINGHSPDGISGSANPGRYLLGFRPLVLVALFLGLCSPPAFADPDARAIGGQQTSTSLSPLAAIADYQAFALANNPGLLSAGESWHAARSGADHAGAWPDPKLSFGYLAEGVETRVGAQRWKVGVNQSIPWFGKRALKRGMAEAQATAREHLWGQKRRQLSFDVYRACVEYAYLGEAIASKRRGLELLTSLEEVAVIRYRNGGLSWTNMLRLLNRKALLGEDVNRLTDRRHAQVLVINSLLGRDLSAAISTPLTIPDADPSFRIATHADLLADNPTMRAQAARVDGGRRGVALARKRARPDLNLGVEYIATDEASMPGVVDSGKDPIIFKLGISVPLWRGSYSAAEQEAAARLRSIEAAGLDLTNRLLSRLDRVILERREAARRVKLYEVELIPRTHEALVALAADFRTGGADFSELLQTEEYLLEFQLKELRARADLALGRAEIELLVGSRRGGDQQ
ncbi:MAG: TolC family protein [bacterium]|nr:TolC family protein [bacterium]